MAPEQGPEKSLTGEKKLILTTNANTTCITTTTTTTKTTTTAAQTIYQHPEGNFKQQQRSASPRSRKINTTWVAHLNKSELEAYLREMGMDPVGVVEELRRRLITFIIIGYYAADVALRLSELEARHTPGPGPSVPTTLVPASHELPSRSSTFMVTPPTVGHPEPAPRQRPPENTKQTVIANPQEACRRCGRPGHFASRCQNPAQLFCWRCGKVDIRTNECCQTQETKLNMVYTRRNNHCGPKPQFMISNPIFDGRSFKCRISIGPNTYPAVIDTGSWHSYINESVCAQLPAHTYRKQPCSYNVIFADGTQGQVSTALKITYKFQATSYQGQLLTLSGAGDPFILGMDFLITVGVSLHLGQNSRARYRKTVLRHTTVQRLTESTSAAKTPPPLGAPEQNTPQDLAAEQQPPEPGASEQHMPASLPSEQPPPESGILEQPLPNILTSEQPQPESAHTEPVLPDASTSEPPGCITHDDTQVTRTLPKRTRKHRKIPQKVMAPYTPQENEVERVNRVVRARMTQSTKETTRTRSIASERQDTRDIIQQQTKHISQPQARHHNLRHRDWKSPFGPRGRVKEHLLPKGAHVRHLKYY